MGFFEYASLCFYRVVSPNVFGMMVITCFTIAFEMYRCATDSICKSANCVRKIHLPSILVETSGAPCWTHVRARKVLFEHYTRPDRGWLASHSTAFFSTTLDLNNFWVRNVRISYDATCWSTRRQVSQVKNAAKLSTPGSLNRPWMDSRFATPLARRGIATA